MKKIVVGLILIVTIIGIETYKYVDSNKETMSDNSKEHIKSNDMLTMMLETEAGTGVYEEVIQSEWPTDGYVFNTNLSKCENGGIVFWDDENKSVKMKSNISDKCYVYFDIANQTFADYIINEVYTEDGVNGLYFHDGVGTYANANQEAGDNSYRYSGANPNNYVCFGSDAEICPNDNLYRIIGLFDDNSDGIYNIKLVKADYTTSEMLGTNADYYAKYVERVTYYKGTMDTNNIAVYYWNYVNTMKNNWNESQLNIINLNTNYWTYLGSTWQNMIATTNWKIGGNKSNNIYNVAIKNTYQNEIVNPNETLTYEDEIGLMYISDYGYAVSPDYWNLALYTIANTETSRNNNWLYMGLNEWTITRNSDNLEYVFFVYSNGIMASNAYYYAAIRPSFYLKNNVNIIDGTGTSSNPYKVNL